jgi:hypothetical protein
MSLRMGVVLLACVMSAIELAAGISTAPGDEERELCNTLRSMGAAPTPGYAPNMRVQMDSWNYRNLLPTRTGAVWDQVDNDMRNNASLTTNVSLIPSVLHIKNGILFLFSGFSNPTFLARRLFKCVAFVLVLRATGY